jgi:hypothetical protein
MHLEKRKAEAFLLKHYNFIRPHTALNGKTPSEVSRVAEPNEPHTKIKKDVRRKLLKINLPLNMS